MDIGCRTIGVSNNNTFICRHKMGALFWTLGSFQDWKRHERSGNGTPIKNKQYSRLMLAFDECYAGFSFNKGAKCG